MQSCGGINKDYSSKDKYSIDVKGAGDDLLWEINKQNIFMK